MAKRLLLIDNDRRRANLFLMTDTLRHKLISMTGHTQDYILIYIRKMVQAERNKIFSVQLSFETINVILRGKKMEIKMLGPTKR